MIRNVDQYSIIVHMGVSTRLRYLLYDIKQEIEPNLTFDELTSQISKLQEIIIEHLEKVYDTTIYTNKEMLSLITESIEYKSKPIKDLLKSDFDKEEYSKLIDNIRKDMSKYQYYLELITELKRLHDLASYLESYEIVYDYFKGEEMDYNTGSNIPYVLIVQLICKYLYYRATKDINGNNYYDNEYIDEWIKDTMIDLINDKEKHRDVTGTIEITKELGIIDNKDYEYLMGKYNEVKDIKKEYSLLNIDTGPMQ